MDHAAPAAMEDCEPEFSTTSSKRKKKGKKGKETMFPIDAADSVDGHAEKEASGAISARLAAPFTEEPPVDSFEATLAQGLKGTGFDPTILQQVDSSSYTASRHDAAEEPEPNTITTTSSKRKKKGKKDQQTATPLDDAGSLIEENPFIVDPLAAAVPSAEESLINGMDYTLAHHPEDAISDTAVLQQAASLD